MREGVAQPAVTEPADAGPLATPAEGLRAERIFAGGLALLFLVLALARVLQHVMWRDEWQAWMFCRDSVSLLDLWTRTRTEGHPALWHLLLYALSRVTRDPLAMKLAHVALATGVVYVVAKFSPFMRLQKMLFAFSYFAFFEYAIVSRCYALAMLLAVVACAVMYRSPRRVVTVGILLALLAQTSIFAALLATGMAAGYVAYLWSRTATAGASWGVPRGRLVVASLIFAGGIGICLACCLPGPTGLIPLWTQTDALHRLSFTLGHFWRSWVPVPELSPHFWGTNILNGVKLVGLPLIVPASLGLFLVSVLSLWRRPGALAVLVLSAGAMLVGHWKAGGSIHHFGLTFMALVAASWLSRGEKPREWLRPPSAIHRPLAWLDKHRGGFLTTILLVQAAVGVGASVVDWVRPFSAARETAGYIQSQHPGLPIIGHPDYAVSSVSGYLDRPIYYLSSETFSTHCRWDLASRQRASRNDLSPHIRRVLAQAGGGPILLIVAHPALARDSTETVVMGDDASGRPSYQIRRLRRFEAGIVTDEDYSVYLATPLR